MLFLASCSGGFVRKLVGGGGILSMAVSMWGVGYNGGGFSRSGSVNSWFPAAPMGASV